MGKKGYTPRKKAYPTVQREGYLLDKLTEGVRTAAYFWYVHSGGDGLPWFVCDFCDGNRKAISLFLDPFGMRQFLECCYRVINASLFEMAREVVYRKIDDPDKRLCYKVAMWGLHFDSLTERYREGDLDDLAWETKAVMQGCDYERSLDYLEQTFWAELALKEGEAIRVASVPCFLAPQNNEMPYNELRAWLRPYDEENENPKPWKLLAQHNVLRYAPDAVYLGNRIAGDYLGKTSDTPVVITVSDAKFRHLLDQIDYRLRKVENGYKKTVCD